jgi:hypothetical protein
LKKKRIVYMQLKETSGVVCLIVIILMAEPVLLNFLRQSSFFKVTLLC